MLGTPNINRYKKAAIYTFLLQLILNITCITFICLKLSTIHRKPLKYLSTSINNTICMILMS